VVDVSVAQNKVGRASPLDDLIPRIAGLIPEVQADLAFQVLDQPGVPPSARRTLLELAWQAADAAREGVPLSARFRTTESREAVALHYRKRKVDAVSIRLTVVEYLLRDDPAEALSRFTQMQIPESTGSPCSAVIAPDYSQYYAVAAALLQKAFPPEGLARGDDVAFVRRLAATVPGVLAFGPWLKFVRSAPLPPSLRQELLNTSTVAVLPNAITDRDLAIAESRDGLTAHLESAVSASPTAGGLLAGMYRRMLETVLASTLCADSVTRDDAQGGSVLDLRLAFYNRALRPFASPPSVMSREDYRLNVSTDSARKTPLPDVPFLHLIDNLRAHRYGLRALPPERRASADPNSWEVGVTQFLHRLDAWQPPPSASVAERAAFFHQRASFYLYLVDSVPSGPLERRAVDRLISLLENDEIKRASPSEWMGKVGAVLLLARRADPSEQARLDDLRKSGKILSMAPRTDSSAIRDRLRASRDPELAAYAYIEERFPVPYRLPG
jgi:hypothetical protein